MPDCRCFITDDKTRFAATEREERKEREWMERGGQVRESGVTSEKLDGLA